MAVQSWTVLKKIAQEYGAKLISALSNEIKSAKKVATGDLLKSLKYKVVPTGSNFTALIFANDYIKILDQGRRRGAKPPPMRVILKWMDVRKIKVRSSNGRFAKNSKSAREGMAFAIANKIGRDGFDKQPHHVIQKALTKVFKSKSQVEANAREYLVKDIKEQLILTLKKKK